MKEGYKTSMSYSVCKLNSNVSEFKTLYDGIEKIEEAELLSQLAMSSKNGNELIFMFPGWNRGINNKKDEYEKALKLADEYKEERINKISKSQAEIKYRSYLIDYISSDIDTIIHSKCLDYGEWIRANNIHIKEN